MIHADLRHPASSTQRQGFWNALVYIITSQTACRHLWRAITGMQQRGKNGVVSPVGRTNGAGSDEVVVIGMGNVRNTTGPAPGKKAGALGSMKSKGHDSRRERFASRRTSERLESDESSVASLRRGV